MAEHPFLVDEWDCERNRMPVPHDITSADNVRRWWRCRFCGYKWRSSTHYRYVRRFACPACNSENPEKSSCLPVAFPDVAAMWDMEANDGLTAYDCMYGSVKKVGWVCPRGHHWRRSIANMCASRRCPVCSGRMIAAGFNDLATVRPDLAAKWDRKKNTIDVHTVGAKSLHEAWWVCERGHSWKATVLAMAKGLRCPVCSDRRAQAGFNDLASMRPDLMAEWDWDANRIRGIDPHAITYRSSKHVSWVCSKCGYRWQAKASDRALRGQGCPACGLPGRIASKGVNDLASQFPLIAAQWDVDGNNGLRADAVRQYSNRKAAWICPKGHHWHALVYDRTLNGAGCPVCSGRTAESGVNDVATLYPQLMKDWDWTRNNVDPHTLRPGSDVKVHWKCHVCGFRWASNLYHRTGRMSGCPQCLQGKQTSEAEDDIARFVESLTGKGTVVRNDRTVLESESGPNRELDIYVPSLRFAIEYNGVHWHTERLRGRDYHYLKYRACEDKGIRLLQVWSDDWTAHPDIIRDHIRVLCHDGSLERVNARSCAVAPVDVKTMRAFMDANHVQGGGRGNCRLGLFDGDGRMVAGMVCMTGSNGVMEVRRYSTLLGTLVRGGFSRLFKHAVQASPSARRAVTFSDNMVSDGLLYARMGFRAERTLKPDYMYINPAENVRRHKFNYRISRFRRDPGLEYREGMSERELAMLNGLERVYDAGKVRWVMDVNTVEA